MENPIAITTEGIKNKIFTIRNEQVMLDSDLADMYGVETKILNQAVKRNIERFPEGFMFQLSEVEMENLRSQFVTSSSNYGGRRYNPFVFTEQGVAMLSSVLRSKTAIKISIQIMQAFVQMRKFIANNAEIFRRLDNVEKKQFETDEKFDKIFKALENKDNKPVQGIFFDGQVFDAYSLVSDIIRSAEKSIVLIDNYVDDTVLQLFTKRKPKVETKIYTKKLSQILQQDVQKHNEQYEEIKIEQFSDSHDRFLIIDNTTVYHIGASLKDLGKKWFAFSKMNINDMDILNKLQHPKI